MDAWRPGDAAAFLPSAQHWTAEEASAAALLVQQLGVCHTVQRCSLLWFLLTLLHGSRIQKQNWPEIVDSWGDLFLNFTKRMARAATLRGSMREMRSRLAERRWSGPRAPADLAAAERDSVLLLVADTEAYFARPHVEPFARHLGCYAAARGMGFERSTVGLPKTHTVYLGIGDDAANMAGWYFSSSGAAAAGDEGLGKLVREVSRGSYRRLPELVRHERAGDLMVTWRDASIWGKIWAIEEQLDRMASDALLIFFDPDVTIRPDSWHRGIGELLLNKSASRADARDPDDTTGHVFVADTWHGAECVNGGFTAFRNTEVARQFLRMWREKMAWPGGWNQGALAETILEVVGMEMLRYTKDASLGYQGECVGQALPNILGQKTWGSYCACWHQHLERLAGPYRRRWSQVVSFVDPEQLEVNYVAHNLFVDHEERIEDMRLAPWKPACRKGGPDVRRRCREGLLPPLSPLVVHWAGIGKERTGLMEDYLLRGFNLSAEGCPRAPPPAHDVFGTKARQIRCCEFRLRHANGGLGDEEHELFWGCNAPRRVNAEDCDEYHFGPL